MSGGASAPGPLKTGLFDAAVIAALTALLIGPMFSVGYYDNWGTIDSTFIAHARFLVENWPHPSWQPLWYGGTRFDYIYPPALPYGTALLSMGLGISIAHAYHLYTAILYTLGIAGVYVFVRIWSRSRGMAWMASVLTALASPSFLLIADVRYDAMQRYLLPQRLNALAHWGEGPHISSLSLIPWALAAAYWALTRSNRLAAAGAAVLCALAVANNFYGSVSLAVLYSLMVWSLWAGRASKRLLLWAAGIPVLAYGLTAVWLTPSYLRITLANLGTVEASGGSSDMAVAALLALLYLGLSARYGLRRPERSYALFVVGFAAAMFVLVLSNYWFGLEVLGTPSRLVPETDLALTLLLLEVGRRLIPRMEPRLAAYPWAAPAAVVALAVGLFTLPYPRNAWRIFAEDTRPEARMEYRLTDWISKNLPGSRLFVDGSLRFWYNAWHNLPQYAGGSDQGMLNRGTLIGFWEMRMGEDPHPSTLWMQAYGVDAVAISSGDSQDAYRSIDFAQKFDGVLPVIYDKGEGDKVYRIPRRFPAQARVVEKAAIGKLQPVENSWEIDRLEAYVAAVEQGPDSPARLEWQGPEAFEVSATVGPDELLLLQQTYDPYWTAEVNGASVPVRPDVMGQMLVEPPPGEVTVRVQFETPLENRIGAGLTLLSLLGVVGLAVRRG